MVSPTWAAPFLVNELFLDESQIPNRKAVRDLSHTFLVHQIPEKGRI